MSGPFWIGIDLGGTKILAGLFDNEFNVLSRAKLPTLPEEGGEKVFGRIIEAVDTLLTESKIDPSLIKAMGLAVPGQIVPGRTIIRYAPNLGWKDYDLQPLFPATWTWPIHLENDVRAGTYGEWFMGAAQGARNVFGIFLGTGVGGGLILNNELFHGFNGHAGEVGHIVIHWRKGTSLEGVAGRRSMMKRAAEMLVDAPRKHRKDWKDLDLATVKSSQLAKLVNREDPIAVSLVEDAARAVAAGMASVINLLSPEVIVIGGGVGGALGEPFRERAWELAQKYCLPRATEGVRCVSARLGDDAGIIGAAANAKHRLEAHIMPDDTVIFPPR